MRHSQPRSQRHDARARKNHSRRCGRSLARQGLPALPGSTVPAADSCALSSPAIGPIKCPSLRDARQQAGSFLSFRTRRGSRASSFGCKKSAKDVLRWNFERRISVRTPLALYPLPIRARARAAFAATSRSFGERQHGAKSGKATRTAHVVQSKNRMPSMPVHKRLLDSCWTLTGRLALSL